MDAKRPGLIRRVFGGLWRLITWMRIALSNLLFLLILIALVTAISIGSRHEVVPTVPDEAVLVLNPSGVVVEQRTYSDPFAELLSAEQGEDAETVLWDMVDAVDAAADDERIRAMVISPDAMVGAGMTRIAELAAAIARFRDSGKSVIAVADDYSQDQYLLAVQADKIWMHPMGSLLFTGFGGYRAYYAEALEKLKIDVHVLRAGQYKSAFEFIERSGMSDEDRLATGELLNALWSRYTAEVTGRRELSASSVDDFANGLNAIMEQHGGDLADAALELGFIDALMDRNQRREALEELAGGDLDDRLIGFDQYLDSIRPGFPMEASSTRPEVGVLVASGTIVDGEGAPGQIGGESLASLIRDAADDESLKALVLRVDSPGGSAFASEIIREAVTDFQAGGKPLVVSMGAVAASGGYWISASADQIWASDTTITGSIGVIGAVPSVARGLAELGIHTDGVGTTRLSGALDPARPLSDEVLHALQLGVDDIYGRFVTLVAEGRGLEPERVLELAGGRVWSGAMAHSSGLVDSLGRLDDAVAAAASLAGLGEDFEPRFLEPDLPWHVRLMKELGMSAKLQLRRVLFDVLGLDWRLALAREPAAELLLNDPAGTYALCVVCPGPT